MAVEPKRKSQQQTTNVDVSTNVASAPTTSSKGVTNSQQQTSGRLLGAKKAQGRSKGTPLRRARIIITVQRTEAYTLWLTENPHHLAGDGDEDIDVASTQANATAKSENEIWAVRSFANSFATLEHAIKIANAKSGVVICGVTRLEVEISAPSFPRFLRHTVWVFFN